MNSCISEDLLNAQTKIRYYLLVKRSLSDDDVDIRSLASEVVGIMARLKLVPCRDAASQDWWTFMKASFGSEPAWQKALLRRIVDHATIGKLLETQ
jgi:hypothetical protein